MNKRRVVEFFELDFSHVDKNEMVRLQGKTLCIKTKSKGYFSLDLERFPTRQDLAKVEKVSLAIYRYVGKQ